MKYFNIHLKYSSILKFDTHNNKSPGFDKPRAFVIKEALQYIIGTVLYVTFIVLKCNLS